MHLKRYFNFSPKYRSNRRGRDRPIKIYIDLIWMTSWIDFAISVLQSVCTQTSPRWFVRTFQIGPLYLIYDRYFRLKIFSHKTVKKAFKSVEFCIRNTCHELPIGIQTTLIYYSNNSPIYSEMRNWLPQISIWKLVVVLNHRE